jgi:hypothetical protein
MKVQMRDIDPAKVGSKPIVENFVPTHSDYGPESEVFAAEGMGFSMGWIWGHCTTEDGTPHMFARWLGIDDIITYTWVNTSPDIFVEAEMVAGAVPGYEKLYQGEVRWFEEGDRWAMRGINPMYPSVEATFSATEVTLKDGDHFDLTIRPVGTSLKFQIPGPPKNCGYTSTIGIPSGTINGSRIVKGYAGCDRAYGLPGNSFYRGKLHSILEEFWLVWGGIDEDGKGQHGHVAYGPGEFRFGVFERDGDDPISIYTDQIDNFEIEWGDKDGKVRPAGSKISFGGLDFEGEYTGSNALPGVDLMMDWVTGTMRCTNRDDIAPSTGFCEFFKNLTVIQ